MASELFEFSIVVAASDHNPTILNPDFLSLHSIIPKSWNWKIIGPPISTPPFATVQYDSGVVVTVETNKFQVVDKSVKDGLQSSRIIDIAKKYVEVLPHVRYTAVGINFRSFAEHPNADKFMKEHFLKSEIWDSKTHPMQGAVLKFVYPLEKDRLFLSLESVGIEGRSNDQIRKKYGILAYGNFHRDCHGYPGNNQVVAYLKHTSEDWSCFNTTLSHLLGINDAF